DAGSFSHRARTAGFLAAFRSHRSRPLALLAQLTYDRSSREGVEADRISRLWHAGLQRKSSEEPRSTGSVGLRGFAPEPPAGDCAPCTPAVRLDRFSAGDAPATPSVRRCPEGRSRCGRGGG